LLRIYEKMSSSKKLKNKKFFGYLSCPNFTRILFLGHHKDFVFGASQGFCFWGITPGLETIFL
jgi:hypothetical protein